MSFFEELKRRNVIRVGIAYVIVAWIVIQIADVLAPQLNLPEWTPRMITFVILLGFPVSLVMAWALDLTPQGVVKAEGSDTPIYVFAAAFVAIALVIIKCGGIRNSEVAKMLTWFKQLDKVLRGDATQLSNLETGKIDIPVFGLSFVLILLGLIYGACMGSYSVIQPKGHNMQIVASMAKFPLLFFLTLVVTFPSLYVFNALIGSRLSIISVLRLLIAALGVILAVVTSLGPIVVFFAVSTTSYSFMILLNVAMCAIGGVLGLAFLLRTLHRLVLVQEEKEWKAQRATIHPAPQQSDQTTEGSDSESDDNSNIVAALDLVGDATSRRAKRVFQMWVLVFALVGAQMSWVLRPFIGNPDMPFAWFRARESNFFEAVISTLQNLFSIGGN